jgi:hypothetical protein
MILVGRLILASKFEELAKEWAKLCLESANFFCSLVFLLLAMIEARLHY